MEPSACIAEHWQRGGSAPPGSQSAHGSTAICMLGELRYHGLSLLNMRWALRLPLREHHFFYVGPNDAAWDLHRPFVTRLPYSRFGYDALAVRQLGHDRPLWQLTQERGRRILTLNAASAPRLAALTADGRPQRRFVHLVVQLWQQHHCLRMVRAHEVGARTRFARIVKARADAFFFTRLPVPRPDELLWPGRREQDVFFDGPRDVAAAMLDSTALVQRLLNKERVATFSGSLIQDLWRQRLRHHMALNSSRRVVVTRVCRSQAPPWCFLGFIRGSPACGAFDYRLESPDPEDFPPSTDKVQAAWDTVPSRLRIVLRNVSHVCFGGSRRMSAPMANCSDVQGDPGSFRAIDVTRRVR
ncbi:hypothetical protein AB1Y20_009441 [Prymnesium parvum]|uniref:Protein xylosyltransferase n=1 Tax=Prymnesium parvum TaxID=97485 RepID=A0AB34K1L8_PRYPA